MSDDYKKTRGILKDEPVSNSLIPWSLRTWLTIRFILLAMRMQGYYGLCYDGLLTALRGISSYEYDKIVKWRQKVEEAAQ